MRAGFLLATCIGLTAACTNPRESCEEICAWYVGFCDEDEAGCVDDCLFAPADTFAGAEACVESTPSSCRAASCCVQFVYSDYNYEQECLQN
jgi:hypothetical protein